MGYFVGERSLLFDMRKISCSFMSKTFLWNIRNWIEVSFHTIPPNGWWWEVIVFWNQYFSLRNSIQRNEDWKTHWNSWFLCDFLKLIPMFALMKPRNINFVAKGIFIPKKIMNKPLSCVFVHQPIRTDRYWTCFFV